MGVVILWYHILKTPTVKSMVPCVRDHETRLLFQWLWNVFMGVVIMGSHIFETPSVKSDTHVCTH
jgi:hypothetical protein